MALFKIWLTFSEQLHFWQQSGTARPQSKPKIQHLHPPKQKANPVILCCHVSPMENPISQVIKLVGLKNGVGSLGTKPFDISFRNKIYLSKKGVPVLTMTFYWNPKENYPAKSEGDYQWGYHLPPSPAGTNPPSSVSCGTEHPAWGVGYLDLVFPVLEADHLVNAPPCCPSPFNPYFSEEIHVPTVQNKIFVTPLSYIL